MNAGHQSETLITKILILFSCIAIVFAVMVWLVFDWRYTGQQETMPIAFDMPQVPSDGVTNGQYSNAIERPLFWPSRSVSIDSSLIPEANNVNQTKSDFRFVGALLKGEEKQAMLVSKKEFYKVQEGDKLNHWTVKKVTSSSVILVSASGELEVAPAKTSTDTIDIKPLN